MNIAVLDATEKHAEALKTRLREADINEIWAVSHSKPEEALERAFSRSKLSWTIEIDNVVAAIFGVAPVIAKGEVGSPWFLGSNLVEAIKYSVARGSHEYIEKMTDIYPFLYNWVDRRNEISKKWLRWCGFHLEPAMPYGFDQLPFHYFWKRRI